MSKLTQPVGPGDHVRGNQNAPVTMLEYGDYECPFCGRAYGVVEELLRRVGDEVRFAYRHFPLTQIHPHAAMAAQAAEAAGAQGQFWAMHSALFENQDALELDDLTVYAQAIGLNVPRFVEELRSGAHMPEVASDFRSGIRSGVNGTPTFFINGARLDGAWDADSLLRAVAMARTGELSGRAVGGTGRVSA
jgi:protein-disulfide isomerase